MLRISSNAQYADQAFVVHQGEVDARLHTLQLLCGLLIDFHHSVIGQYQLRSFVPGVDAVFLAAPQDQSLAVHDVDVVGKNRHGAIHDVLSQLMVQFEHVSYIRGTCLNQQ
ncbi:hypothetical protein D3C78_737030 [compost metagenome]